MTSAASLLEQPVIVSEKTAVKLDSCKHESLQVLWNTHKLIKEFNIFCEYLKYFSTKK